jgi:hypothetical protein
LPTGSAAAAFTQSGTESFPRNWPEAETVPPRNDAIRRPADRPEVKRTGPNHRKIPQQDMEAFLLHFYSRSKQSGAWEPGSPS